LIATEESPASAPVITSGHASTIASAKTHETPINDRG
jgi:hypothetical protein